MSSQTKYSGMSETNVAGGVGVLQSGEKAGPAGDTCHMQPSAPSAHDMARGARANRSRQINPSGGSKVSSPSGPMAKKTDRGM
jgi:hypothetical protein